MSLFPVRCFTCGKPMTWEPYQKKIDKKITPDNALDQLKYRRMCCRRMFLSHVPEIEEDMLLYPSKTSNPWDPE